MKGSWNGSRSQSQNINILFQLLDFLLMGNTETLFLVNDQKPQILTSTDFPSFISCEAGSEVPTGRRMRF